MPKNIIDANARRARVLELLRQAVRAQLHFWELQTRMERAMLDGDEMDDSASDRVLDFIKDMAAGAPIDSPVYDAITDEHVTMLFRAVDVEQVAQEQIDNAALFDNDGEFAALAERDAARNIVR